MIRTVDHEPRTVEEMRARARQAQERMGMWDRGGLAAPRRAARATGPVLVARTIYLPVSVDAALAAAAANRGTDPRGVMEALITEALRRGLVDIVLAEIGGGP